MLFKFEQLEKAVPLILLTDAGMFIVSKLVQSEKAPEYISIIDEGNSRFLKLKVSYYQLRHLF